MPPQVLPLHDYKAEAVLLPGKGKPVTGVRVTVFGDNFPARALAPELLVGGERAEMVQIARDQKSLHGYFRKTPADGAEIVVRYGESQRGVLARRFEGRHIEPLPKECRPHSGG